MESLQNRTETNNIKFAFILIPVFFYTTFLMFELYKNNWDITSFIVAGDQYTTIQELPVPMIIEQNSPGYDGQFYFRLALNPFTQVVNENGVEIDYPRFRQQRILYPLIVWVFSFGGNPNFVIINLVFVNFLGILIISIYAIKIANHFGFPLFYGAILVIFPGMAFAFRRNLPDIVEFTCLIIAMYSFLKAKWKVTVLFLSLAILAKETSLILAGVTFGVLYLTKHPRRFLFVIPIFVFVSWQAIMILVWGFSSPTMGVTRVLTIPFIGFLQFFIENLDSNNYLNRIWLIEQIGILVFFIAVILNLTQSKISLAIKISWISYFLFLFTLNNLVWVEDWSFMRALSEFYLLGGIILISRPSLSNKVSLIIWPILTFFVIILR